MSIIGVKKHPKQGISFFFFLLFKALTIRAVLLNMDLQTANPSLEEKVQWSNIMAIIREAHTTGCDFLFGQTKCDGSYSTVCPVKLFHRRHLDLFNTCSCWNRAIINVISIAFRNK